MIRTLALAFLLMLKICAPVILVALALLLTGCAAAQLLPSLEYCHHVQYQRQGTDITLHAICRAPVGL